jgi:microcystin-dependent protein
MMADQFVAEIRIFAGNYPPTGWAFCDGQLLPLSQNTALFSLLGTTYGGDGKSNFALPNIQGQVVVGPGQGPGLSLHDIGESSGSENITLLEAEIPQHRHTLSGVDADGPQTTPTGNILAQNVAGLPQYSTPVHPNASMNAASLAPMGGGLPHTNLQPYLVLTYIIALQGIYPPRTAAERR